MRSRPWRHTDDINLCCDPNLVRTQDLHHRSGDACNYTTNAVHRKWKCIYIVLEWSLWYANSWLSKFRPHGICHLNPCGTLIKCCKRVRVAQWVRYLDYLTTHTSLSPRRRGFAPCFVNYKKGALDSQLQVIKFIRCLSTNTGRHDIAEILLKVVLDTINQIKSLIVVMKKKFKNVFKDLRMKMI